MKRRAGRITAMVSALAFMLTALPAAALEQTPSAAETGTLPEEPAFTQTEAPETEPSPTEAAVEETQEPTEAPTEAPTPAAQEPTQEETAAEEALEICTQMYYAAEEEATQAPVAGDCGEHLTWQFDADTGTLTIDGYGAMTNWSSAGKVPWTDSRAQITRVVLPDGLTSIGGYAFYRCENLTDVTLPDSVTTIGEDAFGYCQYLTSMPLPDGLTSIGSYAFYACSGLTQAMIPDSVTYLGSSAFNNCTGLATVHLPAGLTEIPNRLFYCCKNLTGVSLPEGVTKIGSEAFYWCESLEEIRIPDGVTTIWPGAFKLCESLTDVTIPESAAEIAGSAFHHTPWLNEQAKADPMVIINHILVYASECTGSVTIPDGVTKIADEAFYNSSVESVTIPESVTSIGDEAFYWCQKLTSVTIPDSVTVLGTDAFSQCTALTAITIPGSIATIPARVLYGCTALTDVTIGEGVELIEYQAFQQCTSLVSVTLPKSMTCVRSAVFSGCTGLTDVYVYNPCCRMDEMAFPESVVIHGYEGSLAQSYAEMYGRTFAALDGSADGGYTYEIIPLLPPFNEYFFVRTDNPDPKSFRFVDKQSAYSEDAGIAVSETAYADVQYDDTETLRVNGGYLFYSGRTDGGEVTLQYDLQTEEPRPVTSYNLTTGETTIVYERDPIWADTGMTFTLPELYDDTDYLIHTYATEDSFFDNMDAVQAGFSSVCLYSGSYVRGDVYRANTYWFLSNSPHVDQVFYNQSPYRRQDNRTLLASALYPYRYDSLGFPSMMGSVAKRLDDTATYQWSSSNHAFIEVTYGEETRSYGGQGNGQGQGVDPDQIQKIFTFDGQDPSMTLAQSRELLDTYAALDVTDDMPQEDVLTWSSVCETVGDGAWVRLYGMASVYGGAYDAYAYLYKKDDRDYFYTTGSGIGGSLYWSGSLGYASDTWVDGRYINQYEVVVPGAVFADHPTSSIILTKVTLPALTYDRTSQYNSETGKYEYTYSNVSVEETTATVRYIYNTESGTWKADSNAMSSSVLSALTDLTEQGLVDAKYLDALELTPEEVEAIGVDRNTNVPPYHYFVYNGSDAPGTERYLGDVNNDGKFSVLDLVSMQKRLGKSGKALKNWKNGDLNGDGKLNVLDLALMKELLPLI